MRALIVSDSHGYDGNFMKVLARVGQPDMLIHCGDSHGHEDIYMKAVSCPVKIVSGNNDYYLGSRINAEEEFDIGSHHILLTHGHKYRVSWDNEKLIEAAALRGADIVIFGHTHIPEVTYDEDFNIWAVNPGSISLPRQGNGKPSFIIMEIDEAGEVYFNVNYL